MEDPGTLLTILLRRHIYLYIWLRHVDIDDPIVVSSPKGSRNSLEPHPEQIVMLADMDFTSTQAQKALRETVPWTLLVLQ